MTTIEAWRAVFSLSYGREWISIPDNLKKIIGLDSRMGISGGILCTKKSAQGANEFINRMNTIHERIK